MSELLEEIKEDIRDEQLKALWKKYGSFVIGGVAAILVTTAGYIGWQSWSQKRQHEHASAFSKALYLEEQGQKEAAEEVYENLSQVSSYYAVLAKLRLVSLALRGVTLGDVDVNHAPAINRAVELLRSIEHDHNADAFYSDYALILRSYLMLDRSDSSQLLLEIERLTHKDNPWRSLALEVKAVLLHKEGKKDVAQALLQEIGANPHTPHAFHMRMKALREQLDGHLQPATPRVSSEVHTHAPAQKHKKH